MALLTSENAPVIQSLLSSANMEKPDVGQTVKVLSGKHRGQIGIVQKHIRSKWKRKI